MSETNASQVMWAALVRGLLVSMATGLAAGAAALGAGQDERTAILAGIVAFAAAFVARSGIEGGYDANRARTGNIQPGDVGRSVGTVTTVNTPVDPVTPAQP